MGSHVSVGGWALEAWKCLLEEGRSRLKLKGLLGSNQVKAEGRVGPVGKERYMWLRKNHVEVSTASYSLQQGWR